MMGVATTFKKELRSYFSSPVALIFLAMFLVITLFVTLGNIKSRQIIVMPDMGGIVAEFDRIPRSMRGMTPTLRVWTSEGYDTLADRVTIVENPDTSQCPTKAN